MDGNGDNGQKKASLGRGGIILKMIKMKEEAEALAATQAAAQQHSSTVSSTSAGQLPTEIPSMPVPPVVADINVGHGRAALLGLTKTLKSTNTSTSKESTPTVSQGRASILSMLKNRSSVGQSFGQPAISGPSDDGRGVLGTLKELSIHDTGKASEVSFQKPQPVCRRGTSGKPWVSIS